MDPRHQNRIKILQNLFALSFSGAKNNLPFNDNTETKEIIINKEIIDGKIQKYAPKFPLTEISKIDLSVLRLSIYELTIVKKEPPKVIIDEAVELAKEFGGDKSFAFVNAILGKIYNNLQNNDEKSI